MKNLFIEIFLIIIFILLSILLSYKKDKKFYKDYLKIALIVVLSIGFITRLIGIDKLPVGLELDEASIGFESYSILNYGIDRNGITNPVYLVSWGGGQNALYAYILMPFISILGLSVFSLRLPMAIVGCITLLLLFKLLSDIKLKDNRIKVIILLLFIMMPWLIEKSRWSLESNIFPDLIIYSILLIYYGIKNKNKLLFYYSSLILGISCYAYGTSFLYIPIFSISVYLYFLKTKNIKLKELIIYMLIITIIASPLIIFTFINFLDLNSITLFNTFTIPKLTTNRFDEFTIINNYNLMPSIISNLKSSFNIIINQVDYKPINSVLNYGLLYKYSLPFILIGIYYSFKKHNHLNNLINIMFICSIILCLFVEPNINRINVIWLPLIIYFIYSFIYIYNSKKDIVYILTGLYIIMFISFNNYYCNNYKEEIDNYMNNSIVESINYASSLDYNNLYITSSVADSYIYYLFVVKPDTHDYIKNKVELKLTDNAIRIVSYKNNYFYSPKELKENEVYILTHEELKNYDTTNFKIKYFRNYAIVH